MKRHPILISLASFGLLVLHADWPILRYLLSAGTSAFGPRSAARFAHDSLWPAASAAFLAIVVWGLGSRLMGHEPSPAPAEERHAVAFSLGAGVLASCLFALGLAGCLEGSVVFGLGLAATAFAWPEIRSPSIRLRRPALDAAEHGFIRPLLVGVLIYAAWHGVINALAPPTDLDVLAYHLALPKLYVAAGRIMELPWLLHSHWPHLLNVFYALALFLHGDAIAALLHLIASAALVWSVFQAARLWLDEGTAWLAAALLAAQPVFLLFAGTARVDSWWALFHFLACVSAWRWKLTGRKGWLVRAGILAGLAAASKLLGLVSVAALTVFVLSVKERETFGQRIRAAGVLAACGVLPVLPWYVKTWLGAGDPVWPFFANVFGAKWGAADFVSAYISSNHWSSVSFFRYDAHYFIVIFLVLLLLALARRGRAGYFPPVLRFFLAASLPYGLLVVGHFDAWRLLLPALPALTLSAAWWMTKAMREDRFSSCAAAALGVAAFVPLAGLTQSNQMFAVMELRSALHPSSSSRDVYLSRTLEGYSFDRSVNRLLGRTRCKVLLMPESIGFYLDIPYVWGDFDYQGLIPYDRLSGDDALVRLLRGLDITHILVDEAWLAGQNGYAASLVRSTLRRKARKVAAAGTRSLYELVPKRSS